MYNRSIPMPNAYDFFYQNDQTILALKSENDRDCFDRAKGIPVDNAEFGRHTYGISMTRRLRTYLAEIHETNK